MNQTNLIWEMRGTLEFGEIGSYSSFPALNVQLPDTVARAGLFLVFLAYMGEKVDIYYVSN